VVLELPAPWGGAIRMSADRAARVFMGNLKRDAFWGIFLSVATGDYREDIQSKVLRIARETARECDCRLFVDDESLFFVDA